MKWSKFSTLAQSHFEAGKLKYSVSGAYGVKKEESANCIATQLYNVLNCGLHV